MQIYDGAKEEKNKFETSKRKATSIENDYNVPIKKLISIISKNIINFLW